MKIRTSFALFALLTASPLAAQDLPSADALIASYVEALGGREANLAPTSIRQTGTVTISGLGLSGEVELLMASPNQMSMQINLPGLGQIASAFNGEVGWTINPLVGPMVMTGAELAQVRETANWLGNLRDPSFVPGRETLERAEYGGVACWKVRLTWISGRESVDCYAVDTGLLVATEETQASAMGATPVTVLYSGYREVGGIQFPARITQSSVGQSLEISIAEVALNDVEASAFLPPPAVRTLLEGVGGD